MGGGGTTAVTIPQELKGLFTNTANAMQGLQNYFWGPIKGWTTHYSGSPYSTQSQSNTQAGNGNQTGSVGSGSIGTNIVNLGGTYTALGGDTVPSNTPSGGQSGVFNPYVPDIPDFPEDPPHNPDKPTAEEDEDAGRRLAALLGFHPLDVPGMSEYQQLVHEYIPRVVETPAAELEAQRWAYANLSEAGQVPDDYLDWSLAGRTGYGERMRNDLDQRWDPAQNPLWKLAGFVPSVGDDWSGSVGAGPIPGGGAGGGSVGTGGGTGSGSVGTGAGTKGPEIIDLTGGGSATGGSSGGLNGRLMAALNLFNKTTGESIKNEMESMGLGASQHLGNALEMGRASMIMPLISEEMKYQADAANRQLALGQDIARQRENAIIRQAAQAEQSLGRQERGIERRMAARQAGMNLGMQSAQNETNRWLEALNLGMKQGEIERGIDSERAAAIKDELLRQQALAEQALFGPLGGFLPSTLGSRTSK